MMDTGPSIKTSSGKAFVLIITVIGLAALAWYANTHVSLEQLSDQENRLRSYISLNPWRAFMLGFAIYLVLALVPGTGGKAIVYGWLFGFWQALTIVSVGLTIAALAIFSLSRYLLQEHIERRYAKPVWVMNQHIEKEGAFYLLTLRLLHFPFSILNPVSGASRVRFWTFSWTTALGLLPSNAIWAYVGVRLPSLDDLQLHGAGSLIDPPLIAALAASATLPLLFRWLTAYFGVPANETEMLDANKPESAKENL